MFTDKQLEVMMKMPKLIIEDDKRVDSLEINQPSIWGHSYVLEGNSGDEVVMFRWVIWQSKKRHLKLSLHHQEEEANVGLFRIDYNSGHNNPPVVSHELPEKFHSFAGKRFSVDEHHVHYYVKGYKPLVWALPIINDPFPYKNIDRNNMVDIIEAFADAINLKTRLLINRGIL
jgi:hypothetical protein